MHYLLLSISAIFMLCIISACSSGDSSTSPPSKNFTNPELVTISGYSGDVMEAFISSDGNTLFFNDSAGVTQKDIHYASFVDARTFVYQGPISAINTSEVDGVPTMDDANKFYFVTTANYSSPAYDTLYMGEWNGSSVTGISVLSGLATPIAGFINYDLEVSRDGTTLYFNEGDFRGGNPFPDADTILIATDTGSGFERLPESATILANINTSDLEYAVAISRDGLELFFTRLDFATFETGIYQTRRNSIDDVFNIPERINVIEGFAEGAALSPDEKSLYYHRKNPVTNRFELYRVTRSSR